MEVQRDLFVQLTASVQAHAARSPIRCRGSRHNASMFWTLPTLLTWARIVAIPLIVGVFYLPWPEAQVNLTAAILFVVVAATDWLDVWLASRFSQTLAFGV